MQRVRTLGGAAKGLAAVLVLLLGALGIWLVAGSDGGDRSERTATTTCPDKNAEVPADGAQLKPRIVLQPDAGSQTRVLNLGNDRDPEFPSFAVKSDRALPSGLEKRLSLTADTFTRTGNEAAESVTFPEPTFSELKASRNRERVRFSVCLTPPEDLPAGTYTGLVTLDGPAGVEGATVTITANAKDERLFIIGVAATLAFAFLVLLYKGASDRHAENVEKGWGPALRDTLRDLGWLAPTVFAIVATGGTLLALYDNDPAWGANGLSSVAALIGAGLAAVGAKAIFSPSK